MKKILKNILSYFPTLIPTGLTAHNEWAKDIIDLVGPIADEESMRWVLASLVQNNLKPNKDRYSKRYFAAELRKAAAKQVASQIFFDIKERQRARAEEKAKQEAEATAVESTAAPETTDQGGQA